MARPNMLELARKLGVDRSTISRALSEDKSHLVGAETRERIRRAAAEAGYRPDLTASSLRRGRTNTIGILVSDLENEIFIKVVRQIVAGFAASGRPALMPLIGETRDSHTTARNLLQTFIARRVDAILSLASSDADADMLMRAAGEIPVVLAIRKVESASLPTSVCDDELGGTLVAEHFAQKGHRLVCQIKGPTVSAVFASRAKGFSQGCGRSGLSEMKPEIVAKYASTSEGRIAAEAILRARPRPTAVFAHNDALALGMIEAMRSAGLSCPDDIAIVGYNNTRLAQVLAVPLTTIDYPVLEVSRHAADMVRRLIADPHAEWESRMFRPKLIIRQST